jgi:hypothetical protein
MVERKMIMSDLLNMFLVAPVGHEQLATVIIAETEDRATERATDYFSDLYTSGFTVLNLTEHFAGNGYDIRVTKHKAYGLFH